MGRVEDKVAIITGAARGLGKADALMLASEGADIAIWDINLDGAQQVAMEIRDLGRKALAMRVDITNRAKVEEAVQKVLDEFGKIDILVNNAGTVAPAPTLIDLSDEHWHREINLMLTGTFYCTRAVLKHMINKHSGKIINITSLAGELGRPITSASYSTAKAGLMGFTMSVAMSVAKYGINVNAVSPGVIHTEIFETYTPEQLKELMSGIPLNRGGVEENHGIPEDVAHAVLFLASSESDYVTGTRIRVNGGLIMG